MCRPPFTVCFISHPLPILLIAGANPLKIALPGLPCYLDSGQAQLIRNSRRRLKRRYKGEVWVFLPFFFFFFVLGSISSSGCISFMVLPDSPFLVIPTLLDCLDSQDITTSCLCPFICGYSRDFLVLLISVLLHFHLFNLSALPKFLQPISFFKNIN